MARANVLQALTLLTALVLASFTSYATQPAEPLSLEVPGDYSIGLYSQWLEDPTLNLGIDDVMAADSWQTSTEASFNFGYSDSVYWLRTRIHAGSLHDWALWIRYSLLDYVEFYLCPQPYEGEAGCQKRLAGDEVPFKLGRDVNHPNLIVRFPMEQGQEYLLVMRVQSNGAYQIPASLVDEKTLQNELETNNLIRGGYYATMLVMGLYNLFIFFQTRERSYLYYTLVTVTFLFFHMTYEGSAFQYFWPDTPSINRYAFPLMFLVNQIFLSLFVPNFLNLKKHSPAGHRLFRVYTAISAMLLIMLPLIPYEILVPVINMLSSVVLISALIIGIMFWLQGRPAARFFTIAWVSLITGLVVANTRSFGLLPTNTFTLYAYQIGSFMEVVLLSMALGERIMRLQKEQLETRKAMLKTQEEAIQYLRDYEDLYQNSLTGKFQLDSDGYFVKSNPAWRRMLGFGELSRFVSDNPPFDSLFTDGAERRSFWRRIKESGHVQGFITQLAQPNSGEKLMVSITMRASTNNGRSAWIGSGQNITEEYQKEQALSHLQKEKAQALRQLVMGIAHEMNTPLGNIRMAETFLADQRSDWTEEELQAHLGSGLKHIHEGIDRLNDLNQLMKNAIVQENQYVQELLPVRQWLKTWSAQMLEKYPQLSLKTAIHSYITEWDTYPDALHIIFSQLVDNSCKHNADKAEQGKLEIGIEFRERGEHLELHYRDNGKGIDEEQRDAIFMPFYTTQRRLAESKGLGLYQTYNLLTDLLHGQIEWPADAQGFYLVVRFPLPQEEVTPGAATESAPTEQEAPE